MTIEFDILPFCLPNGDPTGSTNFFVQAKIDGKTYSHSLIFTKEEAETYIKKLQNKPNWTAIGKENWQEGG